MQIVLIPPLSNDRNVIIRHRLATCNQHLKVRACLIRLFLSAESFSGNWMSNVMMRFPLWEGSWDSGIPSPVTTFWYAGLFREGKIVFDEYKTQNT